jgi:26S proteasome regulatory subunit N1
MVVHMLDHLLQFRSADLSVRRTVPIALALLHISNPQTAVIDKLSKLSHDEDEEVAFAAILSLGLVGAGTNHARIAQLLRQLNGFYSKELSHQVVIRLAQGILYAGKGTITMSPYHSDNFLLIRQAISGLMIVAHSCIDMRES